MNSFLRLYSLFTFASAFLFPLSASAQNLPAVSEITTEIDSLSDPARESEENAILIQLKRETLSKVEELESLEAVTKEREAEIASVQDELSKLERLPELSPQEVPDFASLPEQDLQSGHAEATQSLRTAKSELDSLKEEQTRRSIRRLELPEEIGRAHTLVESPAPSPLVESPSAQSEASRLGTVSRELSIARERALNVERQHLDATDPLLNAKIAAAKRTVDQRTEILQAWAKELASERVEEAFDLTSRAQAVNDRLKDHQDFGDAAEKNLALALSRLEPESIQAKTLVAEAESKKLETQLKSLDEQQASAAKRVRLLEAVDLTIDTDTGNILRRERIALPPPEILRSNLREGIIEATRAQVELINHEDEFRKSSNLSDPPLPQELAESRNEVLQAIIDDHRRYIETLGTSNSLLAQLSEDSASYARFIDERLLWIRNGGTIGLSDLPSELSGVARLFSATNLTEAVAGLKNDVTLLPAFWLATSGLILLLILYRRRFLKMLREAGEAAWKRNCTTITPTWKAILLSLLIALPLPLFVAFIASRCGFENIFLKDGLWAIFPFLGLTLLTFTFARKGGLLDFHLGLKERRTTVIRRNLRWFIPSMVVPIFLTAALSAGEEEGTLGRVFFIIAMIILSIFVGCVLRPKHGIIPGLTRFGWLPRLFFVGGILIPLILAVGAALGYLSSVEKLRGHILATVFAALAVTFVYALFLRILLVSRRHLAIRQAVERRAARAREQERQSELGNVEPESDPLPSVEEVTARAVDITSINQQAQWLLRTGVTVLFVVLLSAIWSDLLPAFSALEKVSLWGSEEVVTSGITADSSQPSMLNPLGSETSADTGDTTLEDRSVSLQNLVTAILIALLTIVFARNVPALLELAILPRLSLAPGAGFAITTSIRYIIVFVGIIWAASELHISWNSVQWIAAAVTLGIGFGLQEVFANFVAGIILLFERPMRLGDYVTAGNLSGRVTRIKMRATTIRDFSHKELVIPNKEFITGQFINWTLSDNIVRLKIPVGVAYGSDTKLVKETLLQIGKTEPRSLEEPGPRVNFLGFGDSTLNFELRVHIPGADEMEAAKSDIHFAIDTAFREKGIEIAFPQLDLHVKTNEKT